MGLRIKGSRRLTPRSIAWLFEVRTNISKSLPSLTFRLLRFVSFNSRTRRFWINLPWWFSWQTEPVGRAERREAGDRMQPVSVLVGVLVVLGLATAAAAAVYLGLTVLDGLVHDLTDAAAARLQEWRATLPEWAR